MFTDEDEKRAESYEKYGMHSEFSMSKGNACRVQYRQDHLEHTVTRDKKWRQMHPEKVAAQRKRHRQAYPEKIIAQNKRYYQAHRERAATRQRQYNQTPAGNEAMRRRKAKRRHDMGFLPLNIPFEGADGHHIDKDRIIYIPAELHRSVWHCLATGQGMDEINKIALDWMAR